MLNICVHRIPQKQPNAGFATRKIRVLVIQPSNYTHPHHMYSVAIPLVVVVVVVIFMFSYPLQCQFGEHVLHRVLLSGMIDGLTSTGWLPWSSAVDVFG